MFLVNYVAKRSSLPGSTQYVMHKVVCIVIHLYHPFIDHILSLGGKGSQHHLCETPFSSLAQECEIKEEGKLHVLILHNCRLDQTGGVDFQAANVKSSAHLRVKRKYYVCVC